MTSAVGPNDPKEKSHDCRTAVCVIHSKYPAIGENLVNASSIWTKSGPLLTDVTLANRC